MSFVRLPIVAIFISLPICSIAEQVAPVVVTATRTAETVDETLASVTVISREQIIRQQAVSVQEVLRGIPGVEIANNGGLGKPTSVFLRGTESDHVLVLIDGIKAGSATLGTTAFHDLPVEQIDRIEVVRGPRSSLYGSEAIGGVIQIFTRRGGGPLKTNLSIGGGSYSTYNGSLGVSGGGDHGWFNASVSGIDTKGFNACSGPVDAGCFTIEPDDDGYKNISGSLRGGASFNNGAEIDLHALRTSGETEFDGSFVNETDTSQQILGGTVRLTPTEIWFLSLTLGQSHDDSENFNDGVLQNRFDTKRDSVSFQNDIAVTDNHWLTVGADYLDDNIDSSTEFLVTSRDNLGIFTQYRGTVGRHDVQLSLRKDDNEQFEKETTGGAAWGYLLSNGMRLTANYGSAFKAPTFNELYFPGFGNPTLKPEKSDSVEIGLNGSGGWGRWSINAYHTNIDDLIAFDSLSFLPANVDETRISGIEGAIAANIYSWDIRASLTLSDPENRSDGANRGNTLPRRATESLRVDADRQFGKWAFGLTLVAQGKRYDDLANTVKLDGFATVDLRAEYAIAPSWALQFKIENIFDEVYESAAFFNQPGIGGYVTLRFQR